MRRRPIPPEDELFDPIRVEEIVEREMAEHVRQVVHIHVAVADEKDYRLGGSFFDGKGQPSQSSAVSHGSSTARFNGVNVINTARKL